MREKIDGDGLGWFVSNSGTVDGDHTANCSRFFGFNWNELVIARRSDLLHAAGSDLGRIFRKGRVKIVRWLGNFVEGLPLRAGSV